MQQHSAPLIHPFSPGKIFLQGLILPFKVLRFGNVWLVLYVLGLGACGGAFLYYTNHQIQLQLLALRQEMHFSPDAYRAFSLTAEIVCWFFVLPFVLTAIAVPARGVWAPQHFSLNFILKDTLVTLRDSLRVLFFTARALVPRIFPALALIALYLFIAPRSQGGNARHVLGMAALIVTCVQTFRCLPLLFLPFVTLSARAHPAPVLGWIRSILRGYLFPLGLLAALGASLTLGSLYLIQRFFSTLPYASALSFTLSLCWIWFFLNALMLVSLKATIDHAQALEASRAQRQNQRL